MKYLANSWCLCVDEHDAVTPTGQWAAYSLKKKKKLVTQADVEVNKIKPGVVLTLNGVLYNQTEEFT